MTLLKLNNKEIINSQNQTINLNDNIIVKDSSIIKRRKVYTILPIKINEEIIAGQVLMQNDSGGAIAASKFNDKLKIIGIAVTGGRRGDHVNYITSGIYENAAYAFDTTMTYVYLGMNGMPTTIKPTSGLVVVLGIVKTPSSFMIQLQQNIVA